MRLIFISFLLATILCFSGLLFTCYQPTKKVARGMYYWRTNLYLGDQDKRFLKNQRIEKLYVKIMDITWNAVYHAYPSTSTNIENNLEKDTTLEFVPVVFITNETLLHSNANEIDTLSKNIVLKTKQLCGKGYSSIKEIQIDFDWSPKTKDNYFDLLKKIKQQTSDKTLSVTLRLHQLKNKYQTGIPPADRAMLMLYNMGKITNYNETNSILNVNETKKYLTASPYALPLDFVLPLFDWGVRFTNNKKFENIIYHVNSAELDTLKQFKKLPNGSYQLITDYYNNANNYFYYGDEIRTENVTKEDLISLSHLCQKQSNSANYTISFFELNTYNVNKLDSASYEEIYHCFN